MTEALNILFYNMGGETRQKKPDRGSAIRPACILTALEQLGHNVTLIDGPPEQCKSQISKVKKVIRSGTHFHFVYVENANKPNALRQQFPWIGNIFRELSFFRFLKKRDITIGLFYRDIYWRHDVYWQMLPLPLALLAKPFYYWDLFIYTQYVSHLFLPSKRMANSFPLTLRMPYSALPPGTSFFRSAQREPFSGTLNLLYVGGISKPLYDISVVIRIVEKTPNCLLTICCREDEWKSWEEHYEIPENVHITHKSGDELEMLYSTHHAFVNYRTQHPYLDFCMPVKIFESLSHNLPIITSSDSCVADLVIQYGIGWVAKDERELETIINKLISNNNDYRKIASKVSQAANENSWKCRAETIVSALTQI